MKRFAHSVSLVAVIGLVLIFIGCTKPPDAERSAAKAAMDAATSASAEQYAAADYAAAKGAWDTAESQMNGKKYKEAKQGYIDAKTAFEKAASGVEAGKKAVADEAAAAVTALEEEWKGIEASVKKAAKRMKDKKDAWEADTKAFMEGLQATKDMITGDPVGAKAKANELKTSILDKWDAIIKELTTASSKPETPKK
jgi:hypothetical protein